LRAGKIRVSAISPLKMRRLLETAALAESSSNKSRIAGAAGRFRRTIRPGVELRRWKAAGQGCPSNNLRTKWNELKTV
jgi:hypothetical protein